MHVHRNRPRLVQESRMTNSLPLTATIVQLFFFLSSGLIAIVRKLQSSGLENRLCEGERTMPERVTESVAQAQQEQKIETRDAGERFIGFTFIAAAVVAALVAAAVYAQDKYSLKSPGGIAFLRLQRIRGLGGRLFRSHRRSA